MGLIDSRTTSQVLSFTFHYAWEIVAVETSCRSMARVGGAESTATLTRELALSIRKRAEDL